MLQQVQQQERRQRPAGLDPSLSKGTLLVEKVSLLALGVHLIAGPSPADAACRGSSWAMPGASEGGMVGPNAGPKAGVVVGSGVL